MVFIRERGEKEKTTLLRYSGKGNSLFRGLKIYHS